MTAMLALCLKPLLPLMYALGGGGLSFLWYAGHGLAAALAVVCLVTIGALTQARARKSLPMHPVSALRLFNARPLLYGALAAGIAAVAFIVGIEMAVEGAAATDPPDVKQTKEAFKEIAQTLAGAIGAYLTGLTIAAADVDAAVGDYVKDQFRKAYKVKDTPTPAWPDDQAQAEVEADRRLGMSLEWNDNGDVVIPVGSYPYWALYGEGEADFTDWLRDGRAKRAQLLEESLKELETKSANPVNR